MATLIKLPSGRFKAIIRRHGRTKCKTFTRKTDARTWARNIETNQEALEAMGLPGAALAFSELADLYLAQWSGRDKSVSFKVGYWRNALDTYPIIDISTDLVRKTLADYAAGCALRADGIGSDGKLKLAPMGRPRTAASVNRMRSALSAVFKFACNEGLVRKNPVSGIPARTENNKRVRYLTDSERDALLHACKASSWNKLYCLVIMALTTGARKGELMTLRWSNIDFKRRLAFLAQTKNGEPRLLPLPSPALAELELWREVGSGLVFRSKKRPLKPFEFRKAWQAALDEAKIENFRFHDLRHSAASYLVMNGATLAETAEVLGHKSVQTTMRYAHLSTQHKATLTERIFGNLGARDG